MCMYMSTADLHDCVRFWLFVFDGRLGAQCAVMSASAVILLRVYVINRY